VPVNETSEQNWNGYCNVDFAFTLDQTNAYFICGIKVIFSIMNLHLFLKCIPSDLKSLSSVWFDMHSIRYLLCSNIHSDRSGKWHRKCKHLGTVSVFDRNLYDTDETNLILEIGLTLYCPDLEEIKSSCLNVADFLNHRVVTFLILM